MSVGFTIFLGIAECAGSLRAMVGLLTQLAAAGLILLMVGAMAKEIFVWHVGFWRKDGTNGWSYEVMIILMNFAIVTTTGGRLALQNRLHMRNVS